MSQCNNMDQILEFRYPTYNILIYTLLVFFALWIGCVFYSPANAVFTLISLIIGAVVFCAIEFIFLNLFWQKIIFDKRTKTVMIKKKIFFYTSKQYEIPFERSRVKLEKTFMSGTHHGAASDWVWFLYIDNLSGKIIKIANSPFKSLLKKKQLLVNDFLKSV